MIGFTIAYTIVALFIFTLFKPLISGNNEVTKFILACVAIVMTMFWLPIIVYIFFIQRGE